jgi:hypothetical protein
LDQPIPDELARAVAQRHGLLFAGAGLSMSVGLPSWQQLIEHMADELGLDARELRAPNVSFHTLAEYFRIKQGEHWSIAQLDG